MSTFERPPQTVAVDLTPVRPGGENGGAKIVALELIPRLARIARAARFVLLTTRANHEELAALDAPNVERLAMDAPGTARSTIENLALSAQSLLSKTVPQRALDTLGRAYRSLRSASGSPSLLQRLGADVMLCPFLDPFYDDGSTRFVSIVADLQFLELPEFFPAEERARLRLQFEHVARHAARIVCISGYGRETVVRAGVPAQRTVLIHHGLHRRFEHVAPGPDTEEVIPQNGLSRGEYLLYPANFWRHKNHATLIQAFGLFLRERPASPLKLVLSGAGGTERGRIAEDVRTAGLSNRIVLVGFVSDAQLSVLLRSAFGLIFPSLYEGFGMPVTEAMAAHVPVLCSDATSLPEVAGDAALLFDPRSPSAIAAAIAQLSGDPGLRARMIERGVRKAASFGSADEMAEHYWRVLCEAAPGT